MPKCAIDDCLEQITPDRLFCKAHWFATPKPIRAAVNRTWRDIAHDREAYREAREKAIQWHRDNPNKANRQGSMF